MRSKQYFTSIKNNPHEISTDPICKQIAGNLVNESGNVPRRGVVPKFSDLEVVALNMASEAAPY